LIRFGIPKINVRRIYTAKMCYYYIHCMSLNINQIFTWTLFFNIGYYNLYFMNSCFQIYLVFIGKEHGSKVTGEFLQINIIIS
jgi:hypothetical protein